MFKGPIFIVGLGRSGTKLLRDLLNNHPQISIPEDETGFIPYFISKYKLTDFQIPKNKNRFYEDFTKTAFYIGQEDRGKIICRKQFISFIEESTSIEHMIELLLRYYSPNGITNDEYIWGDKTPRYFDKVHFLKQHYPEAKFIHIYRDARDVALSYKNAWNKSMLRSAHNWSNKIQYFEKNKIYIDFIEVNYNKLLLHPEKTLKNICEFLGVGYSPKLLTLSKPSENLGAAKKNYTLLKFTTCI